MQLSIKYLVGSKKVRTFASAFEQKRFLSTKRKSWLSRLSKKKEFFERLT